MESLFHGLVVLVLASLIGGGSYVLCRIAERVWPSFPQTVGGTVAFLLIMSSVLLNPFPLLLGIIWASFTLPPALVGAWFHRRSGGASLNLFGALLLAAISCSLSLLLGGFDGDRVPRLPFDGRENWLTNLYYLCLWVTPALAPLTLWIWQSLRIRPGVDTHRDA